MSYDAAKDPYAGVSGGLNTIGKAGAELTASDADLARYARITVLGEGEITIIPARNGDAAALTFTPPNGWVSPWVVRRVTAIGGTAQVYTVV